MTGVALTAEAYRIPTDVPEGDGTLAWTATTLVLVRAQADGHTGIGWTYGPAAVVPVVIDLLAPVVAGLDPDDVPTAWTSMRRRLRNAGRPGVAGLALSAADCALWDLKARRHELPLARLLGTARREVPVYGSGGFTTYDAERQHRQLAGWVHEEGIPRVKIKIGESCGTEEERDLDRVAAARRTIGDDAELFVDANGAYQRKQAIRVAHAAEGLDVRWYEEPVSSDDLPGLAQVRDRVTADVTAGSTASTWSTSTAWPRTWTASRSTSPAAAASASSSGRPRWPTPSESRCPGTAPRTSTCRSPPPRRTCGTWSGSTTTSGSRRCSSTARSRPPAARCRSRPTGRATGWSSAPSRPGSSGWPETSAPAAGATDARRERKR
ncbi:hypothetical protein GCM10027605_29320 [Micromonospora zhanjiangensis]